MDEKELEDYLSFMAKKIINKQPVAEQTEEDKKLIKEFYDEFDKLYDEVTKERYERLIKGAN